MTLAFYFDHNVQRAIVEALRRLDIDVLAAFDDRMGTASDVLLLERATALDRLLVTRDRDFVELTARRLRAGTQFRSVVMLRGPHTELGPVIRDLELLARAGSDDDGMNLLMYIPFRP